MHNESHIINKQVFEFTCHQTEHAFQLQKQMESGLQYKILTGINRVLNEWNKTGENIRIEKIELDLAEIPFDGLGDLLPRKLCAAFEDKLSTTTIANKSSPSARQQNDLQNQIELLEKFLLSGSLPWWAGTTEEFSLSETLLSLGKNNPDQLGNLLLRNIFNGQFSQRLFYQTNNELWEQIIWLFPFSSQHFTLIEHILTNAFITPVQNRHSDKVRTVNKSHVSGIENKQEFDPESPGNPIIPGIRSRDEGVLNKAEQPVFAAARNQFSIDEEKTRSAISNFLNEYQVILADLNKSIVPGIQKQSRIGLSKSIIRLILSLIACHELPRNEEKLRIFLKEKAVEVFGNSIEATRIEEALDTLDGDHLYTLIESAKIEISKKIQENSRDNESPTETGEKIYIRNSGLVLISIFLPALFKELNWADDRKFKTRELQLKALFLLHYMSTGEDSAPEYTLQLNKILCGLNLEDPIPFSASLTEGEKAEAEQMLKEILIHWSALKSSSIEALRVSFLIRDGLLSYKNKHWLLQVERKGYDILVDDYIPWTGWKMIKLGWMETYIEVEW